MIRELPEAELSRLLNGMSPDDRTALLEREPPDEIERLLMLLGPEEQRIARSLLSYGSGTVGRLMTPDFVAIKRDWTIAQVLDHIRRFGKDSETLNVVYVTDEDHRLIDDIRIREILLAMPDRKVESLMDERFVALSVTDEESEAVGLFRKYDRSALPVIDGRGTLLGIVTVDDVLDVAEEEATREIQKFGGLEALDDPYMATPVWEMVKKRATWLVILFVGEMLTASAMGYYGVEIERAVVLALLCAAHYLQRRQFGFTSRHADRSRAGRRRGQTSQIGGWSCAARSFQGWCWVWCSERLAFCESQCGVPFPLSMAMHWPFVGLTVAISLVGIVLWGTLSGSMLPFVLKRLGFDPATSSAPFVATLGGCDWAGDLLQRGSYRSAREAAVIESTETRFETISTELSPCSSLSRR